MKIWVYVPKFRHLVSFLDIYRFTKQVTIVSYAKYPMIISGVVGYLTLSPLFSPAIIMFSLNLEVSFIQVYAKAKECSEILSVEDFAIILAKHFTSYYKQASG